MTMMQTIVLQLTDDTAVTVRTPLPPPVLTMRFYRAAKRDAQGRLVYKTDTLIQQDEQNHLVFVARNS